MTFRALFNEGYLKPEGDVRLFLTAVEIGGSDVLTFDTAKRLATGDPFFFCKESMQLLTWATVFGSTHATADDKSVELSESYSLIVRDVGQLGDG